MNYKSWYLMTMQNSPFQMYFLVIAAWILIHLNQRELALLKCYAVNNSAWILQLNTWLWNVLQTHSFHSRDSLQTGVSVQWAILLRMYVQHTLRASSRPLARKTGVSLACLLVTVWYFRINPDEIGRRRSIVRVKPRENWYYTLNIFTWL